LHGVLWSLKPLSLSLYLDHGEGLVLRSGDHGLLVRARGDGTKGGDGGDGMGHASCIGVCNTSVGGISSNRVMMSSGFRNRYGRVLAGSGWL